MKQVKLDQSYNYKNSNNCVAKIYDLKDNDIDFYTAKIKGRYPIQGYCVNTEVKEIIYVIKGHGKLYFENNTISFKKGDVIIINKGEKYFWNAKCIVGMACNPALYPEQHNVIN